MFEFIIIFHSTQLDINCIQIASLRLATMQDVGCTFVILLLFCYCIVRIKSKQASKLVGGDIQIFCTVDATSSAQRQQRAEMCRAARCAAAPCLLRYQARFCFAR